MFNIFQNTNHQHNFYEEKKKACIVHYGVMLSSELPYFSFLYFLDVQKGFKEPILLSNTLLLATNLVQSSTPTCMRSINQKKTTSTIHPLSSYVF